MLWNKTIAIMALAMVGLASANGASTRGPVVTVASSTAKVVASAAKETVFAPTPAAAPLASKHF